MLPFPLRTGEKMSKSREVVIPGDQLQDVELKPRNGFRKVGDNYFSSYFGVLQKSESNVDVVPFTGPYIPRRGDKVIGKVIEIGPSMWIVSISSPYTTLLHMNDSPWRVNSGDLKKYLAIGDYVYAKVMSINEIKESWLTLKDSGLRRLEGGRVLKVASSKVPRIIGKGGNMVKMIKDATFTKIIIGQNGLIWLDGIPENVEVAIDALNIVQEKAHIKGLTDKIRKYLEERKGDIVGNSE